MAPTFCLQPISRSPMSGIDCYLTRPPLPPPSGLPLWASFAPGQSSRSQPVATDGILNRAPGYGPACQCRSTWHVRHEICTPCLGETELHKEVCSCFAIVWDHWRAMNAHHRERAHPRTARSQCKQRRTHTSSSQEMADPISSRKSL